MKTCKIREKSILHRIMYSKNPVNRRDQASQCLSRFYHPTFVIMVFIEYLGGTRIL